MRLTDSAFKHGDDKHEDVKQALDDLDSRSATARDGGDSWLTIGMAMGVTKQAAQKRFGH